MKSSELFLKLKKDMEKYKSKIKQDSIVTNENDSYIHHIMSNYNLENSNEIINSSFEGLDNEEKLKDFQDRIDHYFSLYAPNDNDFKEFIKAISIYLTFITEKPLHPPGIVFSDGKKVYKKENVYYCTGKSVFIKDKLSLCKYCVCR